MQSNRKSNFSFNKIASKWSEIPRLSYLLVIWFLLTPGLSLANIPADANLFIMTVDSTTADESAAGQFTMPSINSNYQVYWEEVGNEAGNNSGGAVHVTSSTQVINMGAAGIYRIAVDPINVPTGTNDFDRIGFSGGRDDDKLLTVDQWGSTVWQSFNAAFSGASNFTGITATDIPDLSASPILSSMFMLTPALNDLGRIGDWDLNGVTLVNQMFRSSPLVNPDVSTWDTSTITNMGSMFQNAESADPDVSAWDTSSVTNMGSMFQSALVANPDVSAWDTSSVTNMGNMFYGMPIANPDVSAWDTSQVQSMSSMFYSAPVATPDTSSWNTSQLTSTYLMFGAATSANPDVSAWDTSSVTNMLQMFLSASSATPDVSGWDTSSVTNMGALFQNAVLADPDVSAWDTSSATNMGNMFYGATVANPDVSGWDTSQVTSMSGMFYNAKAAAPNTSGWDTSNVTTMYLMFAGASAANPDVSAWDTSSVTSMLQMFLSASIATPDVSAWDTSSVSNMGAVFQGAALADPDVSGWDTSAATNMSNMFYGATIANPDVSGFDTSQVQSMSGMFYTARVATPDTSGWDTSQVTTMYLMFAGASLANPDVSGWDTSQVTNMLQMFLGASVATPDVSGWDTSSVTNMGALFQSASMADPDVSGWDTSSVTNMSNIFYGASVANPDVSAWDTSQATTMQGMFYTARVATPDTSGWDTSNVTSMYLMFAGASLANPDVSGWDTSSVTNMLQMFLGAHAATPDVSGWDTSSVTNMGSLFQNAEVADPDVSAWDTSSATNMGNMFYGAAVANPDVGSWDTSLVTNMQGMFYTARVAQPDTSSWDTSNVTSMYLMFAGASLADPDVSAWDTSSVTTMRQMFLTANSANPDMSAWDTSNVQDMLSMFQSKINNTDLTGLDFDSVTNVTSFLSSSGISAINYDNFLVQLESQNLPTELDLGALGVNFCQSEDARNQVISTADWTITDGGRDCTDYILLDILEDSNSVDGGNNADNSPVTVFELQEVTGLQDVMSENATGYQQAIADETTFSNPPLVSEVQVLIDDVNEDAFLQLIFNASSSPTSTGSIDSMDLSVDSFASIDGLEGVVPGNEEAYQQAVDNTDGFSNPPTLEEIQLLIDSVNSSESAIAEVQEDSASEGGNNNVNGVLVSGEQLESILGIESLLIERLAYYQSAITSAQDLGNPPSLEDVQGLINAGNTAAVLDAVLEDSLSVNGEANADGQSVTIADLSQIVGLLDIEPALEDAYQQRIASNRSFSTPPTVAEVQLLIDIVNLEESDNNIGSIDADLDGIPNILDQDSDNDGLSDIEEGTGDSDNDGVPDYLDLDSDNDGIHDLFEARWSTSFISNFDVDLNGSIDAEHEVGTNGITDILEQGADSGLWSSDIADTDEDGVPDYLDLDSDNDGLFDTIESDHTDEDLDGRVGVSEDVSLSDNALDDNRLGARVNTDSNARQLSNQLMSDDGLLLGAGIRPRDSDEDGRSDYRDPDSDNDGLMDIAEAFIVFSDRNNDGRIDGFLDENVNGVDDELEESPPIPLDTDDDGILDAVEVDSDADGMSDLIENGGVDLNADGRVDNIVDANEDGVDDGIAAFGLVLIDSDGDGTPDFRDDDSDGDGISDLVESEAIDADGDGRADTLIAATEIEEVSENNVLSLQPILSLRPIEPQSGEQPTEAPLPGLGEANALSGVVTGAGVGCSIVSISSNDRTDPIFLMVIALSFMGLLKRRKRWS